MQAVTMVRHLLRSREDDSCVLDDLAELLAAEPDQDVALLSQGTCSGVPRSNALPSPCSMCVLRHTRLAPFNAGPAEHSTPSTK